MLSLESFVGRTRFGISSSKRGTANSKDAKSFRLASPPLGFALDGLLSYLTLPQRRDDYGLPSAVYNSADHSDHSSRLPRFVARSSRSSPHILYHSPRSARRRLQLWCAPSLEIPSSILTDHHAAAVWTPLLSSIPDSIRFIAFNQRSYAGSSPAFQSTLPGGTDATEAYRQDLLDFLAFAGRELALPAVESSSGGITLLVRPLPPLLSPANSRPQTGLEQRNRPTPLPPLHPPLLPPPRIPPPLHNPL